jgi:hypothetical protein
MTSEFQAGKLILSQIGMFNEATILLENVVQAAVLEAIDECVEEFVKAEQWIGNFELAGENIDCWLAPAQWNIGEKGSTPDSTAWFAMDTFNDSDDYWTALFCNRGSAGGEAGFMFGADDGTFGKKMAWNKSFRLIAEATIAELKTHDFKVVDNSDGKRTFFLPIRLDSEKLAETWGNDGEFAESDECFEPIRTALEKLKLAWPIFDGILKAWPVKA